MSDRILRGPRAHSVTLVMDEGRLSARWECHASEGADCRLTCLEGCESWSFTDHEHKLEDSGECNVVTWLENLDLEESHVGMQVIYQGPFEYEWDDGYTFTLPESGPNAWNEGLKKTAERFQAENAALREMLAKHQTRPYEQCCSECGKAAEYDEQPHEPGCALAALLGERV